MAHFLDNDWNVYIISIAPATGVPTITGPTQMHLKHKATNELDTGSTHNGHALTGSSRPNGGGFEITFSEKIPAGGGTFQFRPYTGNLMDHKLNGGTVQKVIGGFRGALLNGPLLVEDHREVDLFTGQNDGIWIATQP